MKYTWVTLSNAIADTKYGKVYIEFSTSNSFCVETKGNDVLKIEGKKYQFYYYFSFKDGQWAETLSDIYEEFSDGDFNKSEENKEIDSICERILADVKRGKFKEHQLFADYTNLKNRVKAGEEEIQEALRTIREASIQIEKDRKEVERMEKENLERSLTK